MAHASAPLHEPRHRFEGWYTGVLSVAQAPRPRA